MADIQVQPGPAPFFSVLIPAFNAESLIGVMIRSLKQQSFPDFEVWIADDGSTDATCAAAESVIARDPRFHLLRLNHGGTASRGRNAALRKASGRYILMADSDDFYDTDAFERFHTELVRTEFPDVLSVPILEFFADSEKPNILRNLPRTERCLSGFDALLLAGVAFKGYSVGSICRRAYLLENELYQRDDIYLLEDLEWSFRVYYFAKRIAGSDCAGYHYLHSKSSVTTSCNPKHLFDAANVLTLLTRFHRDQKKNMPKPLRALLANLICSTGWSFFFKPSSIQKWGLDCCFNAARHWACAARLWLDVSWKKKAVLPLTVLSRVKPGFRLCAIFFRRIYYPLCGW